MFYAPYAKEIDGAIGLLMEYPLKAKYNVFVDYISPRGNEGYYTFTTRPWYEQAELDSVPYS